MFNGARWKLSLVQAYHNNPPLVILSWFTGFLVILKMLIIFTPAKTMAPFGAVLGIINPIIWLGAFSLALLYLGLRRSQWGKWLFWLVVLVLNSVTF